MFARPLRGSRIHLCVSWCGRYSYRPTRPRPLHLHLDGRHVVERVLGHRLVVEPSQHEQHGEGHGDLEGGDEPQHEEAAAHGTPRHQLGVAPRLTHAHVLVDRQQGQLGTQEQVMRTDSRAARDTRTCHEDIQQGS